MNKDIRRGIGLNWTNRIAAVAAVCVLVVYALLCITAFSAVGEEAAPESVYTQDFSDQNSVNQDFSAFYVKISGGRSYAETVGQADGHWTLDEGSLVAAVEADDDEDAKEKAEFKTEKFSVLTYKARQYLNFEVSVDYQMGGITYLWPAVAFRQSEMGKSFLDDGAAAFMQKEGKATIWGSKLVGGPYESGALLGYDPDRTHTMKVVVIGNDAAVWIDGQKVFEKRLSTAFYQEGYISLISVNNNCRFDNLAITPLAEAELAEPPAHKPVESSMDENSLDRLAGIKDDIVKIERELDRTQNDSAWKLTLWIALSVVGALLAGVALLIILKRKKRVK
jgi:hypothetical protein